MKIFIIGAISLIIIGVIIGTIIFKKYEIRDNYIRTTFYDPEIVKLSGGMAGFPYYNTNDERWSFSIYPNFEEDDLDYDLDYGLEKEDDLIYLNPIFDNPRVRNLWLYT